jgi:hypothetical protein
VFCLCHLQMPVLVVSEAFGSPNLIFWCECEEAPL